MYLIEVKEKAIRKKIDKIPVKSIMQAFGIKNET